LEQVEIKKALDMMATGRSPRPDGVLTEFYSRFWDTIGEDFTSMLQLAIGSGSIPASMTAGLIALLPKEGDQENLSNYGFFLTTIGGHATYYSFELLL
jgi:hypothetical protein